MNFFPLLVRKAGCIYRRLIFLIYSQVCGLEVKKVNYSSNMIKLEGSKFEPSIFYLLESEDLIFLIKNKIHEKNSLLVPQGWLYIQTIFIPYLQPDLRDQKLKNCVIFQQKKMDGSKAEPSISYLLELSFFHFFLQIFIISKQFCFQSCKAGCIYNNLYPLYTARSVGLEDENLCNIPIEKNGWFKS